ncbi:hypothetical protein PIB30_072291 [Stylosanthes scabra]|uniref:Uncharacterized protein n=1 Tax=Stylosanthes scabra TaxID=79078 RepID=A0ABU6TNP4_9FABA|nr:hypothetical protein [Stylosanthes scabra]
MLPRSCQLCGGERGMGTVCGFGVQYALCVQCLSDEFPPIPDESLWPEWDGPTICRTLPCAARRKVVPSPPELETRWTWLSAPRRDAVCAGVTHMSGGVHAVTNNLMSRWLWDGVVRWIRVMRMMAVTNSSNTGDEEMVCDSAAEAEMPTDNKAEAVTDGRTKAKVMTAYIAAAVIAINSVVVMADNTENPDTADLSHDDTEGVALAYIPERPHYPPGGPRRPKTQDIPVQSDPSSGHRK